jgi:predicted nucleic-acid-binding protein
MKIIADTNVLVRAAVVDDLAQARVAAEQLALAEIVAVPLAVLCEFVWVLLRGYGRDVSEVAAAIRRLANTDSVRLDRPAVEAGLALLEAGGDFADGVIAFDGRELGGLVFTSFDRKAVELISATGVETCLLPSS